MAEKKIRVLFALLGLDGHTRGAYVVMRSLRDAGMEVIYLGPYQTPKAIVDAAIIEDVDVIALRSMGYYRLTLPAVMEELKKRNITDICVVAGGVFEPDDKPLLESMGITGLFGPGTPLKEIIDHIKEQVKKAKQV